MTLQEQYDAAMFDFSRGDFAMAVEQLKQVLARDPAYFDAQLALGMAHYRLGDFAAAIAEGHQAEKLRPKEQLVHTNLSLFYMKSGDKVTAEHHGLQARIAGWRAENAAAQAQPPGAAATPAAAAAGDPELQMARPKPPPVKIIRLPDKFPEQPWKKKIMKSAYELAMERLNKTAPTVKLSAAQKQKISELESEYGAKIAAREIALKGEIALAAEDVEKENTLRDQLATDRRKLQAELEDKKERVRQGTAR